MFDLDEGAPPADLPMDASDEMPATAESIINRPSLRFHAHEGTRFLHPMFPSNSRLTKEIY